MANYNLHITIEAFSTSNDGFPYAKEYSFWTPVIGYFLNESDTFEIHCWEDEQTTMNEILNELDFAAYRKEQKVQIASGELNAKARKFILSHALNEAHQLKWFSVFLERKGSPLFSSEHYGIELIGYDLNGKQKDFLVKTLPTDASIFEW